MLLFNIVLWLSEKRCYLLQLSTSSMQTWNLYPDIIDHCDFSTYVTYFSNRLFNSFGFVYSYFK